MKRLFVLMLFLAGTTYAQESQRFFVSITRDSNATAYASGDFVMATDSNFVQIVPEGDVDGRGRIVGAKISVDTVNIANGNFRLFFLHDTTGLGKKKDNTLWAATQAEDSLIVGYTDFVLDTTGTATGSVAKDYNTGLAIDFNGSGPLYAVLTATAAYTPKSAMKVYLTVWVE